MKYIKTYEVINEPDLYWLLCKFLEKIKTDNFSIIKNFYERTEKKGVALAFLSKYKSDRDVYEKAFTIRILQVNDKQLRDSDVKPKLKIHLNCGYDDTYLKDRPFIVSLEEFIISIFEKYSYFNKKRNMYLYSYTQGNKFSYDFYINTSDIEKIINELNNNFEMFMDTKKYNL